MPEKQAYDFGLWLAAEHQLAKSRASSFLSYLALNAYVYHVICQAFNTFLYQLLIIPLSPLAEGFTSINSHYRLLSPGVRLLIGTPDMLCGKMGVDLGGRYVSVPQ